MPEQPRYLSYLLRLWQTSDQDKLLWRASLECPGTGQRLGFASLQELFDFLAAQADGAPSETHPPLDAEGHE